MTSLIPSITSSLKSSSLSSSLQLLGDQWFENLDISGVNPSLVLDFENDRYAKDILAPSVPTNLAAEVTGLDEVTLTWDASTGSLTDYYVEYSTDEVTWVFFSDGVTTTTGATVTGLTNGTLYYFRVRAKNDGGLSDWSTSVSATPGFLGLKSIASISNNVEFEITPTNTDSVASNSAQEFNDLHGDTNYVFYNGANGSVDAADGTITGAGTSAGKITFGDTENSQFKGTPPTFLQTLHRDNVARTLIWAGDISTGAGQFNLFSHTDFSTGGLIVVKRGASSSHTLRTIFYNFGSNIFDCTSIPTGQASLVVITWDNGVVNCAVNSRTFTSPGSFTTSPTHSYSGTPQMIGTNGESLGASDTVGLLNMTFLNTAITNTELGDIVDYFRTNYDDLSGLPTS